MSDQRQKIAILGGRVGGIAAAFALTSTDDLRSRYAVTVYQLGWRLGGRASGRNAALGSRIEEHGAPHLVRLTRTRSASCASATWSSAVRPRRRSPRSTRRSRRAAISSSTRSTTGAGSAGRSISAGNSDAAGRAGPAGGVLGHGPPGAQVAARPVDVARPAASRARGGGSPARRSDRVAAHGRTRGRVAVRGGGDCDRRRTARGRLPHRRGTGHWARRPLGVPSPARHAGPRRVPDLALGPGRAGSRSRRAALLLHQPGYDRERDPRHRHGWPPHARPRRRRRRGDAGVARTARRDAPHAHSGTPGAVHVRSRLRLAGRRRHQAGPGGRRGAHRCPAARVHLQGRLLLQDAGRHGRHDLRAVLRGAQEARRGVRVLPRSDPTRIDGRPARGRHDRGGAAGSARRHHLRSAGRGERAAVLAERTTLGAARGRRVPAPPRRGLRAGGAEPDRRCAARTPARRGLRSRGARHPRRPPPRCGR